VTEYPLPTANANPSGIAGGSDGALWFSESGASQIGRITTAGVVTEYPLPEATRLYDITIGPDGNLWFTEFDANKIGRITTGGVVTEFLIPTAGSGPRGITAGPNGNLWLTEFRASKIGRVGVGNATLTVSTVNPASGPSAGGTAVTIAGSGFAFNATVMLGLKAASNVSVGGATQASASTPALDPGALDDVVVTNPDDGSFGILTKGWLSDFSDVLQSNPFHPFVETLVRNSITAGCGGGNYCPGANSTRAQMAVFLLVAADPPGYAPPACVTPAFADVPCSSGFASWINELAARGVTAGCGGGNYCPTNPVTRGQMAVFLLRTKEGNSYTPPACVTPAFADVPCSSGLAIWINELAARGITAGCGGGNYCPGNPVTRGQMAVFLTTTFGLP
jgi:hypothetical protein